MIIKYLYFVTFVIAELRGQRKKSGFFLLYHPLDITTDCVESDHLRYDISFGMGMSDTISLMYRNIEEVDYKCITEVITPLRDTILVVVVKYPTDVDVNCRANKDAFTIINRDKCLRLCDMVGHKVVVVSPYFVVTVKRKITLQFLSNTSINSDIKANMYQVTVTTARVKPGKGGCNIRNETMCVVDHNEYCFTSGVVCDGIKNCGAADWYDERIADCSLPLDHLNFASIITVIAAVMCAVIAAGHILVKCLPPLARSFFVFNANEDNRLCIEPLFESPVEHPDDEAITRNTSLIPVSSSSLSPESEEEVTLGIDRRKTVIGQSVLSIGPDYLTNRRRTAMKSIQEKICLITGLKKKGSSKTSHVEDA